MGPLRAIACSNDTLLRCNIFSGRESEKGQKRPPTFAPTTAELTSIADTKARNR
jgi:hypothetical protein